MRDALLTGKAVLVAAAAICYLAGDAMCKPGTGQMWTRLAPLAASRSQSERPFYIECLTSSECFKEECCALGRQRFSIPKCWSLGGPGSPCHAGAVAVARNLSYPDGLTVQFSGVYDLLCPCQSGLICDPETSQCVEDTLHGGSNGLGVSDLEGDD